MTQNRPVMPYVMKPTKVYNYNQLMANLKLMKDKYSKFCHKTTPSEFKNVLRSRKFDFNLKNVIHGFVHQKLLEMLKQHEKSLMKDIDQEIKGYINKAKKENDLFIVGTNKITGNVEAFENNFDKQPTEVLFNNEMLYDMYRFLSTLCVSTDVEQEISFLGIEYLKYIERFLKENSEKITVPIRNVESKVSLFVKLKYSREEYNLEVYEGNYVFAEIFVYLRCGLVNYIYKLFEKHHVFFDNVEPKFKQNFVMWLKTKSKPTSYVCYSKNDDYFKSFLINLMESSIDKANHVVSSIEDYLWLQLISINDEYTLKSVIRQFVNYRSKKGLLLVYILTKQYGKAIEYIYHSDIPIYPSFFIMHELSKKTNNRALYYNFIFLVAGKFIDTKRKIDLIAMMKDTIDNFYDVVPKLIVKTKLYDVLGVENGSDVFLDKEVNDRVIDLLKEKNDKKQLVKLHYIIEDEGYVVSILISLFIENILTNTSLDDYIEVADYYSKKTYVPGVEKLNVLQAFYAFTKTPDICTLKRTSLFTQNFSLIDVKYVVEKILRLACEVVKTANDKEMAKKLFKICGDIELSEDCVKYINKQLILYI